LLFFNFDAIIFGQQTTNMESKLKSILILMKLDKVTVFQSKSE